MSIDKGCCLELKSHEYPNDLGYYLSITIYMTTSIKLFISENGCNFVY